MRRARKSAAAFSSEAFLGQARMTISLVLIPKSLVFSVTIS